MNCFWYHDCNMDWWETGCGMIDGRDIVPDNCPHCTQTVVITDNRDDIREDLCFSCEGSGGFVDFSGKWYECDVCDGKGYLRGDEDMSHENEEQVGLYDKYIVINREKGTIEEDVFVLKPKKDKAALLALMTYSIMTQDQALSQDLTQWISLIKESQDNKEDV